MCLRKSVNSDPTLHCYFNMLDLQVMVYKVYKIKFFLILLLQYLTIYEMLNKTGSKVQNRNIFQLSNKMFIWL